MTNHVAIYPSLPNFFLFHTNAPHSLLIAPPYPVWTGMLVWALLEVHKRLLCC